MMLHKGRVHLFWTGGQSVALCPQPKPAHNSPKDDYANTSQPSYFPRNRRRAPRSYNCSAVMWKNKQVFFPFFFFFWKQSVFIKGTTTICVRYTNSHIHTQIHHEKTWKNPKCIFIKWKKATYWGGKEEVLLICACMGVSSVWGMQDASQKVYVLKLIEQFQKTLPL